MIKVLYIFSFTILSMSVLRAETNLFDDACECEPSVTGEGSDGGDVEQDLTDVSQSYPYGGDATFVNENETDGRCNLGMGSNCQLSEVDCRFQFKITVNVDMGDVAYPHPDYATIAGQTITLSHAVDGDGNPAYPWTGGLGQSLYRDIGCESQASRTLRVYDVNGAVILKTTFEMNCADCQ